MARDTNNPKDRAVPSGRLSRLGQFGRLASGVAGGMIAEGARRLADGERPDMRDMMLTPRNVTRVAERLSHLRGAAMKLGQMISMDAGDMLPPELAEIMARLRDNAHRMPPQQLQKVLAEQWGRDWRRRFKRFGPGPIAAASIGQVHRATTHDGRDLAIKVQYPGVRESIDADVDNVATLLRLSRLLPAELDISSLLAEAKLQLHEEADYVREGEYLARFGQLLADSPDYVVPSLDTEFTTSQVLAMSFVEGKAIEQLEDAPQEVRDDSMHKLFRLVLREIFEFGVIQSDPNFANYRYQPDSGTLVLLDFGATRPVGKTVADGYRQLIFAALNGDRDMVREQALIAGFVGEAAISRHRTRIDKMIDVIIGELNRPGLFDFSDRQYVAALSEEGMDIAADRQAWHIPPTDLLFVQRKISGMALLAARLKVRIDVRGLVEAQLGATDPVNNTE
ncbi:Predicted unusual protein kinase regulating ubiquinone biosynthesis, AarF/ABC1/UbiB family [Parasphingorhabdus marina DSM 22363]|uniref:Predicted unusual protein kinase regulating ubiquinone biosynthesis, AarF/ABC1/UbiB family n=1 Tax=Parasphingorhabdus marina DSM 22363 TaxID=1123272 RepID=A0A1N6CSH9_9SPHN|nr:AarF/ABC1/UbiB kinase family protein [Parasphingorhabdus marina]SIN61435.1 Predicted unusual protein kinase regulating ubiquinone biosynthesis, AarF/ABC1/UbiB family [Parasphingorhabdus marina DSM 22363]